MSRIETIKTKVSNHYKPTETMKLIMNAFAQSPGYIKSSSSVMCHGKPLVIKDNGFRLKTAEYYDKKHDKINKKLVNYYASGGNNQEFLAKLDKDLYRTICRSYLSTERAKFVKAQNLKC